MELQEAETTPKGKRRVLRLLLLATGGDLAVVLLLVLAHVLTSIDSIVPAIDVLGDLLFVLAAASVAWSVLLAWWSYPMHRRAVIFLVGIAAVVFLAHLFIVGLPAATVSGSLSGATGSQFNDDKITVTSVYAGGLFNVTLAATGGSPITSIEFPSLPAGGVSYAPLPSDAIPLQPGQSASEAWALPSPPSNLQVSYQYANCYASNPFRYGCIMDEVFYVPEAQGILQGQVCSTTASNCHMEHPWLTPALLAAGMAYLGEFNAAGWRIMPALLGTFSIPIVFGIAWKLSGEKRIAYYSALLLALDVMFFSQSSAGLLDIPMIFFGLAAVLILVTRTKIWKLDEFILSGVFLGLAGLSKETAVFMAAGLIAFNLLFGRGRRRDRLYSTLKMVLVIAWVFAIGLQAYDSTLASPAVPTFVNHVSYIFSYGSSLKAEQLACQPTTGYWCKFPNDPGGAAILPIDWMLYYTPVAYYATSVTVCPNSVNGVCQGGSYSYVALAYYGVTNLLETWTTYVWFPLAVYFLYRWRKTSQTTLEQFEAPATGPMPGAEMPGDLRFIAFTALWFSCTYFPYIGLLLLQRVTYPFYFLPAVPAVAMGASFFLTRSWFSKYLIPIYVGMAFVFFFFYFPDKSFLPDWVRVIIGH